MIPVGPVTVRRRLDASRERVWFALADPEIRATWWPDLSFELTSGGALREFWEEAGLSRDAAGKIDVLVVGHALGFAWSESGDRSQTRVLISLVSDSGETILTIAETGFDVFPDAAHRVRASHEAWEAHLDDLQDALAEGLA
ncbi:SRPBCC family protein [Leucobacter sp. M11]|uniref:SRPBCC family protein n=1 Tax=Leucobacter sp. M11 TaxID=2993565 RepID=UPI002D807D65|nr:SRPBCC domain-containing protein [Leucobacter sp. M11]MEB4614526.1 SRPBCC domain-containing protein [Leucobacter sp. M11]